MIDPHVYPAGLVSRRFRGESVIRLSLGKLLVDLLQMIKRINTPPMPQHMYLAFPKRSSTCSLPDEPYGFVIYGDMIHDSRTSFFFFLFLSQFHLPASGQAVVTGVVPSPPRFMSSIFISHRAQQSHCSSISHRVLLTHPLALSASQFVHKKKSQRMYTSMHSAGLELTKKLTYTRPEDNLIRHRGDRAL